VKARVRYGDERHHTLRLQYEAVDRDTRRGMSIGWCKIAQVDVRDDLSTDEMLALVRQTEGEHCTDCGVPKGALHRLGCDNEECPECWLQFIGCEHYPDYERAITP
jgi:hypothetical protein